MTKVHVQAPTAIIFLCGGKYTDISEPTPVSLRDAFLKISDNPALRGKDLIQAEDFTKLSLFHEHYHDILEFETDLAEITELILLFCESGGSLAELGSFVMVGEIASRLLVIARDKHWAENSFIKLGPLRMLERLHGETSVYVVDDADLGLSGDNVAGLKIDVLKERLQEPLLARLAKTRVPTTFSATRPGHIIKLAVGLIQEYGALTHTEVMELLSAFGVQITEERLSSFLLCAKSVDWIDEQRKGSKTYFVARSVPDAATFVASEGAAIKNKGRRRHRIREHWQVNEPLRHIAITQVYGTAAL